MSNHNNNDNSNSTTHKMTKPQPVSKQRIVNFIDSFFALEKQFNSVLLKFLVNLNFITGVGNIGYNLPSIIF